MIESVADEFFSLINETGHLGILFISFIGTLIVFLPPLYYPFLITSALNNMCMCMGERFLFEY